MSDSMNSASETARPLLFTPITIRGVTAPNRVVASPMCQYHSDDGGPTDWQMMHLGRLATGGSGIVFGEETAVEPIGRKTYACAGLYKDAHVAEYRKLTDFIREQGAVPAIQLGHSGRKGSCHVATEDWRPLVAADAAIGMAPFQTISPSPLPSFKGRPDLPREMDADDIKNCLELFRIATERSADAGYDILEIHGAHGYLIHQFLSPLSNLRTDAYGGDIEGRMRFALEVAEVVRAAWPKDKPLFFRVSAVDGKGGAWNLDHSVLLSKALKERDIDLVDVSSGGITGDTDMPLVPRVPAYQAAFSQRIREEAGIMTIAVGGVTKAQQAEDILQSGQADLVALARELLWNADWPAHAAKELGVEDPFGYMPHEYAFRLRQREAQKHMDINQGGAETQKALDYFLGSNAGQ
jgi:2,4-dienoyl-CoA reductase-like NADH-dependent reductase (Old Yellow Enzyme family)